LALCAAPAGATPRWDGTVEAGYDRFAQVFRITDASLGDPSGATTALRDTTDVFTEMRVRGELRLRLGEGGRRAEVRLLGSTGTDLDRAFLDARYRARPVSGRMGLDADLEVEGRRFRDDASFSLSQDQVRGWARLHPRWRVAPALDLGIEARGEALRYEGFTPYEYDQDRWWIGASAQLHGDLQRSLDLRAGVMGRSVADSSEISYRGSWLRSDLFASFGLRSALSAFAFVERRAFADPAVRSSYWDLVFEPDLVLGLGKVWSLRLHAPQEYLLYDEDGPIYQDAWLGRVGVELARRWGALEVGVEPRWSWQVSPWDTEDEYRQPSAVLRVDLMGTGRVWFTFTEEIGRRLYEDPPSPDPALFSDYTFLRTTLLGSVRLGGPWAVDVFLSDEPRNARRAEDDSRLTLYTLALRAGF
jgi:hypothetical protein